MNSNANVMETVEPAILPTGEAARTTARAGSREFRNLIADVEDLIKRVAKASLRTAEQADASVNIVAALPRIAPVLARHAIGYGLRSAWITDRETLREVLAAREAKS